MKRLLLLLLCLPALAGAEERILSYHSHIRVFTDGMLEVTETIKVRAEGYQIRRGIYRDLPIEYRDRLGNEYKIRFTPLAVQRNGSPEPYHTVRSNRDVRTYFGSKNRFLEHGEHTYVFRYRVDRMLGFFEEHDEIYWNVTGNRWVFPIDKATATVILDFDAPRDKLIIAGYTGFTGSNAQEYSRFLDYDGNIHFQADNRLPPGHGLTVAVGWPKGFVEEPTKMQQVGWLLRDNTNLLIALAGLALVLLYNIPTWMRHGRDPEEGVIVTRYAPPNGFSPASLRYIDHMYYDDKVMTAAIVNLAVKGYLEIDKNGKTHTLRKVSDARLKPQMAPGEAELYRGLFKQGDEVALKNENHNLLQAARVDHSKSLKADYKGKYFQTNGFLNVVPIVIAIAAAALSWNVGGPSVLSIVTIIITFLTVIFFAIIMKRPTMRGRALLDEMLGFKDYLEIAEKEDLGTRNPPDKTPEHFEEMLPYALAMGVEQEWAEKFADVLSGIRNADGSTYSPPWYHGTWNTTNLISSTRGLSRGLNDAVSTAVAPPPGSSSGSGGFSGGGGGGFSGGGGGGGGGGGW